MGKKSQNIYEWVVTCSWWPGAAGLRPHVEVKKRMKEKKKKMKKKRKQRESVALLVLRAYWDGTVEEKQQLGKTTAWESLGTPTFLKIVTVHSFFFFGLYNLNISHMTLRHAAEFSSLFIILRAQSKNVEYLCYGMVFN